MDNLWQDLREPELNVDEFDELFSKVVLRKKVENVGKPSPVKHKSKEVVTGIDWIFLFNHFYISNL